MLWTLLALIAGAMLAGMVSVLIPSRFINYDVMTTVAIVGFYGVGGLVVVAISGNEGWIFRICVVALILSMIVFIFGVWADSVVDWEIMRRIDAGGSVALIVGLLLAHRLLIAPMRATGFVARVSKRTALISAGVLCIFTCFGIINGGFWRYDEIAERLALISGIVVVGSTISTGALALFGPRPGDDEPGLLGASMCVSVVCPRCAAPAEIMSNRDGRCPACRLRIRVEIEEPRCACGYLLYQLDADACPECGRAVSGDDRWASGAPAVS